jgi:sugar phosphate permease
MPPQGFAGGGSSFHEISGNEGKLVLPIARLLPNPGYYGWVIVGIGFLCSALSSPGQSFVISLYLDHLIVDLGISRLELSSLYGAATLAAAACLPFIGGWSDRMSARRFLTGTLLLLGLALFVFANVSGVLTLGFAFFALRLLGQGAIGLGTLTATVRWFRRYRGRALAMVGLGYAFGEVVFPSAIYGLTNALGWRGSLLLLGGLYLFLFVPIVGRLLRERDSFEEPIDGDGWLNGSPEPVSHEHSFSRAETLRMPVFWGLLICLSVHPLVLTAMVFHQVAFFAGEGWDPALVPAAFMVFAISGVIATYLAGLFMERVPTRYGISFALVLLVLAFGTTALPLPAIGGAVLYAAILGWSGGVSAAANAIAWPDYFGVLALGAIKGVVNAVRNAATAAGPPLAAVLITFDGSFRPALVILGGLAALAGIAAIAMRPPRTPSEAPLTKEWAARG